MVTEVAISDGSVAPLDLNGMSSREQNQVFQGFSDGGVEGGTDGKVNEGLYTKGGRLGSNPGIWGGAQ